MTAAPPAYTPTTWVNGQPPAINADNLNKIEQQLKAITDWCRGDLEPSADNTYYLGTASNRWAEIHGLKVLAEKLYISHSKDTTGSFIEYSIGTPSANRDLFCVGDPTQTPKYVIYWQRTSTPQDYLSLGTSWCPVIIGGNVRPDANNARELGSDIYRWQTIYARNIDIDSDGTNPYFLAAPLDDSDRSIFIGVRRYTGSGGETRYIQAFHGLAFRPFEDNVWTLGDASRRWANVYTYNVELPNGGLFYNEGQYQLKLYNEGANLHGHISRWDNRLEIEAEDKITFSIGGFGGDRIWIYGDRLQPNADNAFDLGRPAYRFSEGHFMKVKHYADCVIPSAAPGSPEVGSMYLDDTNDRLYVYTSDGWKSVALT